MLSRGIVEVPESKPALAEQAKPAEKIRPLLEGKQIVKVIAVPDKLVNFVVR